MRTEPVTVKPATDTPPSPTTERTGLLDRRTYPRPDWQAARPEPHLVK